MDSPQHGLAAEVPWGRKNACFLSLSPSARVSYISQLQASSLDCSYQMSGLPDASSVLSLLDPELGLHPRVWLL